MLSARELAPELGQTADAVVEFPFDFTSVLYAGRPFASITVRIGGRPLRRVLRMIVLADVTELDRQRSSPRARGNGHVHIVEFYRDLPRDR